MAEPVAPASVAPAPGHAAVLGRPIAHSLSPVLHNAAYAALGLPWTFVAIDCGEDELARELAARADWAGFALTMPLKRVALDLAEDRSSRAAVVGAANTLLPSTVSSSTVSSSTVSTSTVPSSTGRWRADNTDVAGVLGAVHEASRLPSSATVLGAGGTAQAVVAAMAELGIVDLGVLVRDRRRTAELRATAERAGVRLDVAELAVDAAALGAELVISTLPAGAADQLASARWRRGQIVLDAVYAGWPTAFAASAGAAGAEVLSGALMLLHQACAQVELMTGHPAPAQAMRIALREASPASGL